MAAGAISIEPRADLDVRSVGDELVVHDPSTGRVHSVDTVGAAVLDHAGGTTTLEAVAESVAGGASITQVQAAVRELESHGLVTVRTPGDVSRRNVITKVAAAGAAGVAVTAVGSVVAPGVAAAQTGPGAGNGNGNGGTPATETATVTTTGTMTYADRVNGQDIFQRFEFDMNFSVVNTNTSVSSGSATFVATDGPFDLTLASGNVSATGAGQINWSDGSTSTATLAYLFDWMNAVDPEEMITVSLTITSGRFSQTAANPYPQTMFLVPVNTLQSGDPEIDEVLYVGQMVLGG